ncbi:hypothetical protein [Streptomyces sp.]|uniref:hypothetical protein n=1 Tax=Streptomyces sp. TaxID=1931 RepID=UPI002F42CAB7
MSTKSARRVRRSAATRRAAAHTEQHAARTGISLVKPPPPLPVRTARTGASRDTEAEVAHAALAATARGIHARVTAWHPNGDQVAQRLDHRTLLRHSGCVGDTFTALTLCRNGAEHLTPVTSGTDLDTARRAADACTTPHADLHGLGRPVPPIAWAIHGRRLAAQLTTPEKEVHHP